MELKMEKKKKIIHIASCDWWNIQCYTKSDTKDLYSNGRVIETQLSLEKIERCQLIELQVSYLLFSLFREVLCPQYFHNKS